MIGFVQGHGHVLRITCWQRPRSREGRLVPVEDANGVLTRDVAEQAWSGFLQHDRFYAVGVNFDIAQLLGAIRIHYTDQRIRRMCLSAAIHDIEVVGSGIVGDGICVDG